MIHWSIAAIGLKGAYAKHRLAGANDIDINLGDATLAAMTNLEYDKSGNNNETEEEEQEVYGIFTGFEYEIRLILRLCIRILIHEWNKIV